MTRVAGGSWRESECQCPPPRPNRLRTALPIASDLALLEHAAAPSASTGSIAQSVAVAAAPLASEAAAAGLRAAEACAARVRPS